MFARGFLPTPQNSLRALLSLTLTGILLIGVLAAALYFYIDVHSNVEELRERTLQTQARELIDAVNAGGRIDGGALGPEWSRVYQQPDSGYSYTIYDADRRVVSASHSLKGGALPLAATPKQSRTFTEVLFVGVHPQPMLVARVPRGHLFVVVSREQPDLGALAESIAEEKTDPVVWLVPFVLLAGVGIYFVVGRALQPVLAASKQAEAIGPGSFHMRIDAADLPLEVRPLADAFNGTLDRISAAYEIERRITANAAHELRTPLTVLSLHLEQARERPGEIEWSTLLLDLERMKRVVTQLLDLARKEAGSLKNTGGPPINFSRVVRESAAALLPLAEQARRPLNLDVGQDVELASGNPDDLRDLTTNLIENALIHGSGCIWVRLQEDLHHAIMTVCDEGKPPANADRLFDRFVKGSDESPGAGIGLAIVRQVAANFGGTARFMPGDISSIEVRLPINRANLN